MFVTTSIIGIKNNEKYTDIKTYSRIIDLLLDLMLICFKDYASAVRAYPRDASSSFTHTDILFSPKCTQITSCSHWCLHVAVRYVTGRPSSQSRSAIESWIVDLTELAGISHTLSYTGSSPRHQSDIFAKPRRKLIPICIMPFFLLHILDYATTVYTKFLYSGSRIVVEFVPFLMCISFLSFCVVYYHLIERQQQIATQNYLIRNKDKAQFTKEIESMQRNEEKMFLCFAPRCSELSG